MLDLFIVLRSVMGAAIAPESVEGGSDTETEDHSLEPQTEI